MEWVHVSEDVDAALRELAEDSDRAAAIVAATFVEEHLTKVLRGTLHHDKKIMDEIFRSSGPLGFFGNKIDLAFLTGLFSAAVHRELSTIKDVRNLFAHNLRISRFSSVRVKDKVANLTAFERSFTITNLHRETLKKRSLVYKPDPTPITGPRDRFLRACRYYTAILSMRIPGTALMPKPFF